MKAVCIYNTGDFQKGQICEYEICTDIMGQVQFDVKVSEVLSVRYTYFGFHITFTSIPFYMPAMWFKLKYSVCSNG